MTFAWHRDAPSGNGGGKGNGSRPSLFGGRRSGGRGPGGPRFRRWRQILAVTTGIVLVGVAGTTLVVWQEYDGLASGLPSVDSLRHYQPPTVSRIYSGDDHLMAELAAERRIYVPITAIPTRVKNAFIAIEDQHFYTHKGIDPLAIARAEMTNLTRADGKRPIGASTITQQVARDMVLDSNELSISRKLREMLLALRIEQTLPKDKILEIYLNGIYLGSRAYGVAAAAQTYFNKTLDQLTVAEAATLAALPKSPSNYDPFRHPDAATARRNLVIGRMFEIGAITSEEERAAMAEPLIPHNARRFGPLANSEWFGSEVRRQLIERYGEDVATRSGLEVHTSLDPVLQNVATRVLREGLVDYDRAHEAWRGPVGHLDADVAADPSSWSHALKTAKAPPGLIEQWRLAVVISPARAEVGWLEDGAPQSGTIVAKDRGWMRSHAVRSGDLVLVEPQAGGSSVGLRQVPGIEGAIVTMDVRTGRVLAMVGGWSFRESQFNRATQALRQPGSSFKPFVYLTAMEKGIPPSEKFDDAPVSYGDWHPHNYEEDNWGPTTLHDALRESRNLVTIRLAAHLGMKAVADMAIRAGLVEQMPHVLPAALGAVETTVLRETAAYASIASEGHIVVPSLIDTVQDRDGHLIWTPQGQTLTLGTMMQAPPTPPALAPSLPSEPVSGDSASGGAVPSAVPPATPTEPVAGSLEVPVVADNRPRIASDESAYQITTMMQDVIRHGTGTQAGEGIDREIAGKTGTSQDFHDAWFAGFSPDVVTVVWVGYDTPRSLGKNETGGRIAGPMWNKVMKAVFEGRPKLSFRQPDGMVLARYDTGRMMAVDAFKPDQVPGMSVALNGFGAGTEALTAADTGAENISDSETDMAAAPAPADTLPAGTGSDTVGPNGVPVAKNGQPVKSGATPPAAQTGDIGVGGLY